MGRAPQVAPAVKQLLLTFSAASSTRGSPAACWGSVCKWKLGVCGDGDDVCQGDLQQGLGKAESKAPVRFCMP